MPSPTGLLWEPLIQMRTILANCTDFHTWSGATDATDALNYIFLYEANLGGSVDRFAVIAPVNNLRMERDAVGSGIAAYSVANGSEFGFVERVADYSDDNVNDFLNNIGAIFQNILDLNSTGSYKKIDTFEQLETPLRWQDEQKVGYQAYFAEGKVI